MRTLIPVFLLLYSGQSFCAKVELFTVGGWEVDIAAEIYHLDRGRLAVAAVNTALAASGITKEDQAKKFITKDLQLTLSRSVKGTALAARYRLRYLPAIVIDGKYVVYGTPRREKILELIGDIQ
jgi:hypothetical protein